MSKKQLKEDLIKLGYVYTDKKIYEKNFGDMKIEVEIYSVLARITMVGIVYRFKQQLAEEFHEEVWNDCEVLLQDEDSNMEMGGLGCDFIEASIHDREILDNLTAENIDNNCLIFAEELRPLIKHFGL